MVSDSARARVSVSSQRRSGFTENAVTGTDLDDVDGTSFRFAVVLDPSENFSVILRGDAAEDRTNMGSQ